MWPSIGGNVGETWLRSSTSVINDSSNSIDNNKKRDICYSSVCSYISYSIESCGSSDWNKVL